MCLFLCFSSSNFGHTSGIIDSVCRGFRLLHNIWYQRDVQLRHETTQNSDKPTSALDLVTAPKPYKSKLAGGKIFKFNSNLLQPQWRTMVTPSQNGPESQRYFGKAHHRHSPGAKKGSKQPVASPQTSQQKQQPAVKSVKPQQQQQRQTPPQRPNNNKPSSPTMHFPASPNHRQSRTSPSRFSFSSSSSSSPRSSPSNTPSRSSPNFASSTCYQPPTPASLPKPPLSWTMSAPAILSTSSPPNQALPDPTTHLRLLLNVHA